MDNGDVTRLLFENISNNKRIWAEYNFMLEMFYFQLNIGILKNIIDDLLLVLDY